MPQPVAGAVLWQAGSGHGFPTLAPSMSEPSRDDHPNDALNRTAAERRIRNRALTIGVSVTPFGLSFGAVAVEAHLNLIQVCLLSLVLFSGASQFALVSIIGAGGSYFSAVGTALLLGVRNGLYGARVNALLRPSDWRRLVMAQVTIDESTAMAVSEAPSGHSARAFWSTALSVYVLWNVSTVIGALVGNALGSPATTGLDVAGPAAFIALLAPRVTTLRMRLVALGSGVIALATVPVVPVGAPILIGGLTAVALLLVLER
jgi:predicted branched-subunit amino acid permease